MARSLDLPPVLLPHVDALFAGLDSLGSDPALIVDLLRRAGLPPHARVLDLACGTGGAAVALARRLHARVLGVDACPAFIAAARGLAAAKGVAPRCRFRVGGVREFRSTRKFDLALMLGLFGVEDAAPLLRSHLAPGGLYMVDDAFREGRARTGAHRELVAAVPTLAQSRRVFAAFGDEIVIEHVPARTIVATSNRRLLARISTRCHRLRKAHPELSRPLDDFMCRQRDATTLLASAIRPATWVVRAGG